MHAIAEADTCAPLVRMAYMRMHIDVPSFGVITCLATCFA